MALTLLAGWWGVGQTVAGLVAWPFMDMFSLSLFAGYSCPSHAPCHRDSVPRNAQVPLLSRHNEEIIKTDDNLAQKHDQECRLTLDQLQACGQIHSTHAQNKATFAEVGVHIRGLFSARFLTFSTTLV
ncbi:membrane transporter [Penicillium argentinense]|uniref:Membrane transporter n=1 Tax=Penicillium argentinense TaxID=1131581 RepID=A0A9W9G0K2_9EURO|nr:membrane transporter [Penicillium argentinense]KAJ5109899.1 membrane transporter [Penicillium argentinense]